MLHMDWDSARRCLEMTEQEKQAARQKSLETTLVLQYRNERGALVVHPIYFKTRRNANAEARRLQARFDAKGLRRTVEVVTQAEHLQQK